MAALSGPASRRAVTAAIPGRTRSFSHAGLIPLAVSFGALTAASRLPFRSRYLFAWDSANFALALDKYNVAFHQPQPPGYPLYVAAAHVARLFLGQANASYVALSVVASGLAVTFLTLATARLYGRTTAILAALLLASSSVFWSQGEVAYPYAFLACFTALVAWLCAELLAGSRHADALTVLSGLAIGVGAGFRSELLPFLLPLWLYAALRRGGSTGRESLRRRVGATVAGAAAMLLAVVVWYVPMVQLSGGWTAYQSASGGYYAYFIETTSGAGKLLLGLLENTRALVGFLYNGLGPALLPILYFAGRFFAPQRIVADRRVRFLLLWLLPPLAFYVTVHIGNPGYVLSLLPALCIFAAEAALGFFEDVREAASSLASHVPRLAPLASARWVVPAAGASVVVFGLTNAALFLVANGEGRYKEIRQIDQTFGRQLGYITTNFAPGQTRLVAYDRSRQYRYYLPQYKIDLLFDVAVAGAVTDTSRYWERRTTIMVPVGLADVVFPDLSRNTSDQPGLVQRVDLGGGVDLWVAHVAAGDDVTYGYQYASARHRATG